MREQWNWPGDAEAGDAERLDGADEVEVEVDGGDEAADEVEGLADGNGVEGGEVDVGGGEGQREPAVEGEREAEAGADGQLAVVDDEEDALDPALALLQEVADVEGRLLPHLAVDPVERVALGDGAISWMWVYLVCLFVFFLARKLWDLYVVFLIIFLFL